MPKRKTKSENILSVESPKKSGLQMRFTKGLNNKRNSS